MLTTSVNEQGGCATRKCRLLDALGFCFLLEKRGLSAACLSVLMTYEDDTKD
jgi:hypothetical protein